MFFGYGNLTNFYASRPPQPARADDPAGEGAGVRLTAAVVRVTFHNPENGYSVVKVAPETAIEPRYLIEGGLVAMVGVMPGIEVGTMLEAEGEWVRDAKFGPQFKVKWFKPMLPTGVKGIEVYLASGALKGIGPVTAQRIVRHFGEKTFDVLDSDIGRLAEVPGIKGKTLAKIKEAWKGDRGDRELVTFLGEYGVSPAIAARLRRTYEENALAIVRANPYRLTTDVRGIGFFRADEIARKLGIAPDAPERIEAALGHVLERQAEEGHTWLPRPRLEELAVELLKTPEARVPEVLDKMVEKEKVVAEKVESEDGIFIKALNEAERRVASAIHRLAVTPKRLPKIDVVGTLADFEQRTRFQLAKTQREAVLTFARGGLLILTGGPGTGKTTTVRSIIEIFRAGNLSIKLAAPTGRAARRLAETAALPAETIHRLLNYQAPLGKFGRDAANPIEADLVIVDEASMLDAQLASYLLDAVSPRTCLMLVGDEDQLPSVGPGNVLGDLIASGAMPVVRLTEIFRQASLSMIVTNAHRVNKGLMPWLKPAEDGTEADFYFIEREDPFQLIDALKTMLRERIPRKFHLDPHHDIQVLTPMRRGDLGVDSLNEVIKKLLNPTRVATAAEGSQLELDGVEGASGGRRHRGCTFDEGDRVMQTANNYDKLVYNGDIGQVAGINAETAETMVNFDGRVVAYLVDELDQLTLAYAITIHKSQGSEYPAVIIPVHTQHWIMLQRNLLYTAMTRARKLVCLIGTRAALRRAVANADKAKRYSALGWFLKQGGARSAECGEKGA